uniref:Uncharacterized protein n=1 Tax=viral metagenome TaxID=1070528 RepID=A0A6M3JN61_9ZZZZ
MADTVKVHLKWRNLYDYCKASAKNIAIEYAGKRIEFEDGNIRIETIEEPDRTGKKQDEGYYKIYGKNHYANHEIRKMGIPEQAKQWWCCDAEFGEHEETCPNYKT